MLSGGSLGTLLQGSLRLRRHHSHTEMVELCIYYETFLKDGIQVACSNKIIMT